MISAYWFVLAAAAAGTPPVPAGEDGAIFQAIASSSIKVSNHDNNQGNSTLRLTVDITGRISGCEHYASSFGGLFRVDEILDQVCPALQAKVRFRPALGADGMPTTGRFWVGVSFSLKETGQRNGKLPLRYQSLDQDPRNYRSPEEVMAEAGSPMPAKAVAPPAGPVVIRKDLAGYLPVQKESRPDPANIQPLRPIGDSAVWLDEWTLPNADIPQGDYTIAVRLETGPDGVPYGCEITKPFGVSGLDQLACELLLKRARFYPARDPNRSAIGGNWEGQYRWVVPPRIRQEPAYPVPPPVLAPQLPPVETVQKSVSKPAPQPKVPPRSARPKGDVSAWVSQADYPLSLKGGETGTTGFRLTVGADGRPTTCQITASSGFPVMDERTCMVMMRRARFDPATDDKGQPTSGSYASRIRWQPVQVPPRVPLTGKSP